MTVISKEIYNDKDVLDYLKKELTILDNNVICSYYGVNNNDIIKYIESPEKCGKWPFDFVHKVYEAIKKIRKNYLIPFPKIEMQTEEDMVLSKLLTKNNYNCFGTNTFFKGNVKAKHIIQYMNRSDEIKTWNAYFLNNVKMETKRVKEFLL